MQEVPMISTYLWVEHQSVLAAVVVNARHSHSLPGRNISCIFCIRRRLSFLWFC
jgi:hypothetical protein